MSHQHRCRLYTHCGHKSDLVGKVREKCRQMERDNRKMQRDKLLSLRRNMLETCELNEIINGMKKHTNITDTIKLLHQFNHYLDDGTIWNVSSMQVDYVLHKLVGCLSGGHIECQLLALHCLATLTWQCAEGGGDEGERTSRKGGEVREDIAVQISRACGSYLISYMLSNSIALKVSCLWCLCDLTSCSEQCTQVLISQGVIPSLIHTLRTDGERVVIDVINCFHSICHWPDTSNLLARELHNSKVFNLSSHMLCKRKISFSESLNLCWLITSLIERCGATSGADNLFIPHLLHFITSLSSNRSDINIVLLIPPLSSLTTFPPQKIWSSHISSNGCPASLLQLLHTLYLESKELRLHVLLIISALTCSCSIDAIPGEILNAIHTFILQSSLLMDLITNISTGGDDDQLGLLLHFICIYHLLSILHTNRSVDVLQVDGIITSLLSALTGYQSHHFTDNMFSEDLEDVTNKLKDITERFS